MKNTAHIHGPQKMYANNVFDSFAPWSGQNIHLYTRSVKIYWAEHKGIEWASPEDEPDAFWKLHFLWHLPNVSFAHKTFTVMAGLS